MKMLFFISLLFVSGCGVGTPQYTKLNKNNAFLLTQRLNQDIVCFKVDENKNKTTRCYYVSGEYSKK